MGKLYYLRSWCSQTKIIPDASGLHQLSLKIPIFVLLIFSLPSVHNRKILLNFTKNLIPDRGPSVEYSARYFNFVFLRFKIYLFMVAPTFLKRTINTFESLRFVIESGGKRSGVGDEYVNASSLCRTYRKIVREMSAKMEKNVLRNGLGAYWSSAAAAKS